MAGVDINTRNVPVSAVESKPASEGRIKTSHFFPSGLLRYFALLTASPTGLFSPVMKLALIAVPVLASYSLTIPVFESRMTYNCAWAFLGIGQSPAMATTNAWKARKSGLKFELMLLFIV